MILTFPWLGLKTAKGYRTIAPLTCRPLQVAAYEWARDEIAAKFKKSKLDADVLFAAGCFSGLAHCLASNPMEVLKIRGQVLGAAGGGIVGAIKEIGIPGLYKGVIACWARDIPFSAI